MKLAINGSDYNLPDFLVVGAARSATTTMYYYLNQHPDICMSIVKEPHFFSFYSTRPSYNLYKYNALVPLDYPAYSHNLSSYSTLFNIRNSSQRLGEASTSYLYFYKQAPVNIYSCYGTLSRDVKIIIILRNPVERAWSHYMMNKRNGREILGFEAAIAPKIIKQRMSTGLSYHYDYLDFGLYCKQILSYTTHFDNVKIFLTEDFGADRAQTMHEVLSFLGVTPKVELDLSVIYNVSGKPKNKLTGYISKLIYDSRFLEPLLKKSLPLAMLQRVRFLRHSASDRLLSKEFMGENERQYLIDFYQEEIRELSTMLNRNLDHWLTVS